MVTKPGLDELVGLADLLIEVHYLLRQRVHHPGGQLLPGKTGVLTIGGLAGFLGELVSTDDAAVPQPGSQTLCADPADGNGCLVTHQQDQRPGVIQVQDTFQGGEDAVELGAEPIDDAGAVGDQVQASIGEDPEVGDCLVADA
ncbi:hypothetical protein GCM10010507_38200 [Streptomyces cinnamoneus]|uniref:Uncharacterized protein n=1 Tax=Streptomyces cinnamoneus TaxID=53446 RepID=A0A918WLR2_STRCJ|nr:hypothetical protein GCM10010507_38200 [Streptomyces cinnamoneus]